MPSVIEQAIVARRVLRICYLDRDGNLTERDVEPIVFMAGPAAGISSAGAGSAVPPGASASTGSSRPRSQA